MDESNPESENEISSGAWKRVFILMLFTLVVLATLQSAALVTSTYDLPPGPWSAPLVSASETWHGWTEQAGLAGLTETIAEEVEVLHTAPVTEETF